MTKPVLLTIQSTKSNLIFRKRLTSLLNSDAYVKMCPRESNRKWYKWTYLENRNRLTNIENKAKGKGWGEGIN